MAMQFPKNNLLMNGCRYFTFLVLSVLLVYSSNDLFAQVNTVEFGKNRVQYRKFKWEYYQTNNFNSYYSQGGEGLAKYVAQMAEEELGGLEKFAEYALQRRANIIIYNSYDDMQQTNIGLAGDFQVTGGNTKLVNNKMVVYYNSDHANLRIQVRQGIAKILLDNVLFGDDLGEFAANKALLDLPQWLIDGYVSYAGENWSTELDDQLKSVLMSADYKNFYQFAYAKPQLAGHAFWHYIAENYKQENVTYFLYLARIYRNLNTASMRICKQKFKDVLQEFMDKESEKYYKDIRGRRNNPKGNLSVTEDINQNKDFFNFSPNPAPKSQTYAVVEYKRGIERVVLYENYVDRKVLLKNGVINPENKPNPNYPMMAWDPKGTRLAVIYNSEGKIRFFIYDMISKLKKNKQTIEGFDQIQDMSFMLNANTLLFSAVKKGQSDIYTYDIEKNETKQITNDIWDDLDPSFVAFPGKTGIIYSSNRPSGKAVSADTVLPSHNRYNIFLVDNWNQSEFKQISQLSNMQWGNARFPVQYNNTHFTFVSDENGVANRFAGFFSTKRAGVDTIYKIGDDILRNPDYKEVDSLLRAYKKDEPDTIYTFSVTLDSAYVFPMTNYQSGIKETKAAGERGVVSETRQEGDLKLLYRLKVDDSTLRRRNVNPKTTEYRAKTIADARMNSAELLQTPGEQNKAQNNIFENEFENEKQDSTKNANPENGNLNAAPPPPTVLDKAKHYDYRLKFSADQITTSLFNNDVLVTRYDPFTASLPVTLSSNNGFNGMFSVSVYDLFEDLRFTGMIRIPLINTNGGGAAVSVGGGGQTGTSLFIPGTGSLFNSGGEQLARFDYLKKRIDYSVIYYRKTDVGTDYTGHILKQYTNLFQGIMKYPFNRIKSVRFSFGVRSDKYVYKGMFEDPYSILIPDVKQLYGLFHLEYVHDNTIQKTMNILNGLRYKAYVDFNTRLNKQENINPTGFNIGFDGRYYKPIFQNFIWAFRAAGDASLGTQKIVYYLGGVDGWLGPKAYSQPRPPDNTEYAFQSLAVNLRGYKQNIWNGNNALVLNSEFRFPVFSTLIKKPINNAFIRNFQVTQFIDLGTAWRDDIGNIARPEQIYGQGDLLVKMKAGGVGPFVGGYGFGARSTLLGYFIRMDTGWPMGRFFGGKPIFYFAMGVDF
ncbi:hypothetical protein QEG73_11865 [Chitinophagaceae bacterium 26-R-25]|nr:hypothetical protein [Chitinophagaceae bacterium 26-R-25]